VEPMDLQLLSTCLLQDLRYAAYFTWLIRYSSNQQKDEEAKAAEHSESLSLAGSKPLKLADADINRLT